MSARFTINGAPSSPRGFDATHGQTLELEIEDKFSPDVRSVQFEVYDPVKPSSPLASKDAPLLALSPESGIPSTPSGKVTVTTPGSGTHSYIVRCVVNGGMGAGGRPDPALVYERIVAIRNSAGVRKIIPTESTQYGPRGWVDAQNEHVDAPGGPGPTELAGDVAGPAGATVVERIRGVPVAAGTPADGHVLTGEGGVAKWKAPAIPAASAVPFDPAGTGLAATTAQAAIVEASGILAAAEIPLPSSGFTDTHVYTVPACPAAVITRVWVVIDDPLVGAGSVTVKAGTYGGHDDVLVTQTISAASSGIVAGESIASLGVNLNRPSSGYEWAAKAGDQIHIRLTASGEVTAGRVKVFAFGKVLT